MDKTTMVLQIIGTVILAITAGAIFWQASETRRAVAEQTKTRKAALRPVLELRDEPRVRTYMDRKGEEISHKGPLTLEAEDHLRSHGADLEKPPAKSADWFIVLVNAAETAVAMNVAAWVRGADGRPFPMSNPDTAAVMSPRESHPYGHFSDPLVEALVRYDSIDGTPYYTIVDASVSGIPARAKVGRCATTRVPIRTGGDSLRYVGEQEWYERSSPRGPIGTSGFDKGGAGPTDEQ